MMFADPYYWVALWIFVLVLSTVTALMEIQIEGGNGWAGCLPSWRFAPGWLKLFLNGKDLTGYHVYLDLHLLFLFHLPLLLMGWSWMTELTILSVFFACMVCEDFLWFVLNPHFGWDSFSPAKVPWFNRWIGPFPLDYYFWLIISATLAMLRGVVPGAVSDPTLSTFSLPVQQLLGWGLGFFVIALVITLITMLVTPRIREFLSKDTMPHPGHPGICITCKDQLPDKVIKAFAEVAKKTAKKR